MRRRCSISIAVCALLLATAAYAGPELPVTADMTTSEAPLGPVTTRHRIRVRDVDLRYTATFEEEMLKDSAGQPHATISATSYVRDRVRDVSQRPVIFFFNGGPGASSTPLHFSAFGPRRYRDGAAPKSSRELIDNPETLLDVADLVFIDPVGTGFSRLRGTKPGALWTVTGDAKATLSLIRQWLDSRGRRGSPLFIVGESYGGYRLASMTRYMTDLPVAGLVFVSPMLDASATNETPGNDLPHVFALPTMAAAAWYHEKIDRAGRSLETFFDEAARFAQTDYLLALQQGVALPATDRDRIAQRMSQFIGLPASAIADANLRIGSETFLQTLLPDLVVGRLDERVTGPKPKERSKDRPAADDPALGLNGSNVIRSQRAKQYFTEELGVQTSRDYLALSLDVNFRWDWNADREGTAFYVTPVPAIAELMKAQPQARLLLLGGRYDLATPVLGARYALTRGAIPPERLRMVAVDAGHSPFDDAATRGTVAEAVRDLLAGR